MAGVSNEKCEVKLLENGGWDDCWVSWLCFGVVGEGGWLGHAVGVAIGNSICFSVRDTVSCSVCSNALLFASKGWCDGCCCSIRRHKVVGNVFDEESFSLVLKLALERFRSPINQLKNELYWDGNRDAAVLLPSIPYADIV